MSDSRLSGLYAITDRALMQDALLRQAEQALLGGAQLIQYRDKTVNSDRRHQEATALRQLCQHHQALFIINDDIELALAVDADGVHIGQKDTTLALARQQLGNEKIIGISCNNRFELAQQAQAGGADYIAFGRFYPSATKPDAPQAAISLLQQARQQLAVPVVAIGGITLENAPSLLEAGADMLAVIQGLFNQPDIQHTAAAFAKLFQQS